MDQETSTSDSPPFTVHSADGTPIAVWAEGAGPPLVLVHGSLIDHRAFDPLVPHLSGDLTTFAMNRRGFLPSGDAASWSLERDFEDVAAVIEAVATRTRQPVAVLGHSTGASCAMGGAARSGHVHRLILYEPSLGMPAPPGWLERMEKALAEGRPEDALRGIFDLFDATDEEFAAFRQGPLWADCLAAAPATVRENRAEAEWVYPPAMMDRITAPTLMLIGTETLPGLMKSSLQAVAEIRNARVHVLKDHGHGAIEADPAMLAEVVLRFLEEPGQVQDRPASLYSAAP